MSLFRRAPREVYRVYGEDEYLEGQIGGAGLEDTSAVAGGEVSSFAVGGEAPTFVDGGEAQTIVAGGEAQTFVAGAEAPTFVDGGEAQTIVAESGSWNPEAASSVTTPLGAAGASRGRGALAAIALLVAAVAGVAVLVVLNMRSGRPREWTAAATAPVRSSPQRRFVPPPVRSVRRRPAAVRAPEPGARGGIGSGYRVFSRGGPTRARARDAAVIPMPRPLLAARVPPAIQPTVIQPRPAEQAADEFGFER